MPAKVSLPEFSRAIGPDGAGASSPKKFIQTGCPGLSEDIETHRRIMGTGLLPEDLDGTTCPIVFTYPASPHLAAAIDSPQDRSVADREMHRKTA